MLNRSHIVINLAGNAIPTLITVACIPLLLDTIGAEKYGVLAIVWLVYGYFGLLDFGIARAVTNAVSKSGDMDRRVEIIWTAIHLSLGVGILIAITGLGAFHLVMWLRGITPRMNEIRDSMPWLVVGMPIITITATISGALDGIERFKDSNFVQIFGSALYQIAPLLCGMYFSKDLSSLIASVILSRFITLLAFAFLANERFKLARNYSFSKTCAKQLFQFGASIATINIFDMIFSRLDQLLIAEKIGAQSVAAYNIAMNATVKLSMLPLAMSRSVFPKLSAQSFDATKSSAIEIRERLIYWWTLACICAIAGVKLVFDIWLPVGVSAESAVLAETLIVGLWINCLSIIPYTALQAQGLSGKIVRLHLIEAPLFCVMLYHLTTTLGTPGAALSFVIRNLVDYLLLWRLLGYTLRRQGKFFLLLGAVTTASLLRLQATFY